jgi:hypothetical protein
VRAGTVRLRRDGHLREHVDRIQRQIFNQSCAKSGCHDSQTQQGGLLLESGASYTNLIDVAPQNLGAVAAGWKRVDAANASAETSFLCQS